MSGRTFRRGRSHEDMQVPALQPAHRGVEILTWKLARRDPLPGVPILWKRGSSNRAEPHRHAHSFDDAFMKRSIMIMLSTDVSLSGSNRFAS